jgi:hypothetical protein
MTASPGQEEGGPPAPPLDGGGATSGTAGTGRPPSPLVSQVLARTAWWLSWLDRVLPRRLKVAAAGYLVVAVFVAGAGLARLLGVDQYLALVVGAVMSAPLVVALVGERITGIKAFSVEISLSDVEVALEGDFSSSVMETAEMGASASPDLLLSFQAAIKSRSKLMRINLRDEDYWWSTRVFLVAAIALDYTDVEALVFVRSGEQRVFVGICAPRLVRVGLATEFPSYESAYRKVRAEAGAAGQPDRDREVFEILGWRWRAALQPSEADAKQIVTRENLKKWLEGDLDDESLPYGPLNPLMRYRITTRPHRYSALTDQSRLAAIVDRDEVALRSAIADLQQRLG